MNRQRGYKWKRLVPEEIKACMAVDGFRQKIARTLSDRETHAGK
jgi:hypothetical protein